MRTQWIDEDGVYRVDFFDGPKGEERKVSQFGTKGEFMRLTTFVGGPKGQERRHVAFMGDGPNMNVDVYVGPTPGTEALRRQVYDNGEVRFYDGPIHVPRLRRVVTPEGEVRFYTGDEPNRETLVRVVTPEGEVITEFGA